MPSTSFARDRARDHFSGLLIGRDQRIDLRTPSWICKWENPAIWLVESRICIIFLQSDWLHPIRATFTTNDFKTLTDCRSFSHSVPWNFSLRHRLWKMKFCTLQNGNLYFAKRNLRFAKWDLYCTLQTPLSGYPFPVPNLSNPLRWLRSAWGTE